MNLSLQEIFLKSNLYPQLVKNKIVNIKDLILTKPKKYENFFLSDINKSQNEDIVNICGVIIDTPLLKKTHQTKKVMINFRILIPKNIILKVFSFNVFFLIF